MSNANAKVKNLSDELVTRGEMVEYVRSFVQAYSGPLPQTPTDYFSVTIKVPRAVGGMSNEQLAQIVRQQIHEAR